MEELNPELKRDLAISLVCELMDKYKDKPRPFTSFGMPLDSLEYDPALAFEFAISGADAFNAFFEILKSIKSLKFEDEMFFACLDKEVCMTANDPVCCGDLSTAKSFVIKNFFKYTKRLELNCRYSSISDGELIALNFGQMQNLKELVVINFDCSADGPSFMRELYDNVRLVQSIEAPLNVFEAFNRCGIEHKLQKMVLRDSLTNLNLERVFKLSNFMPVEFNVKHHFYPGEVCEFLKKNLDNDILADVKKFALGISNPFANDSRYLELDKVALLVDELVVLVQNEFPVLEEFDLDFIFSHFSAESVMFCSAVDAHVSVEKFKTAVNLFEDFLKERQDKLKLNVSWTTEFYLTCFSSNVATAFMKMKFPDYLVIGCEDELKKLSFPSKNSVFSVTVQLN